MEAAIATVEDVSDAIEGAVITRVDAGDGGFTFFLEDGRAIVCIDCTGFAVVASKGILQ